MIWSSPRRRKNLCEVHPKMDNNMDEICQIHTGFTIGKTIVKKFL